MSSLADHEARATRAKQLAQRCAEMGNAGAEQAWLIEAGRQQRWVDAFRAHPAYRAKIQNRTDQEQ